MKKSEGPVPYIWFPPDPRLKRERQDAYDLYASFAIFFLTKNKHKQTNKPLSRHIFSFFHNPQI